MNVEGMLPFEDMVAAYVKYTGRHVLYRVTPIYEGKNLVASGVLMEAYSVETDFASGGKQPFYGDADTILGACYAGGHAMVFATLGIGCRGVSAYPVLQRSVEEDCEMLNETYHNGKESI